MLAVVFIIACSWLLHRTVRLIQYPVSTLSKIVNIRIPPAPRVTLDSIASTSVMLHWSLPENGKSLVKHVIQINGTVLGESEKQETCVSLTGLSPNKRYSVRVVAVNDQNIRSSSDLLHFCTRQAVENASQWYEDAYIQNILTLAQATDTGADFAEIAQNNSMASRQSRKSHKASSSTSTHSTSSSISSIPPHQSLENIVAALERVRTEARELDKQIEQTEHDHAAAESSLLIELEIYRNKKKEEDLGRLQLRAETKHLEEAKRTTESVKLKSERTLKVEQDELNSSKQECEDYEARIDRMEAHTLELQTKAQEHQHCAYEQIEQKRLEFVQLQAQSSNLEEENKALADSIKEAEKEREARIESAPLERAKLLALEDQGDADANVEWNKCRAALEVMYAEVFRKHSKAMERRCNRHASIVSSLSLPSVINPTSGLLTPANYVPVSATPGENLRYISSSGGKKRKNKKRIASLLNMDTPAAAIKRSFQFSSCPNETFGKTGNAQGNEHPVHRKFDNTDEFIKPEDLGKLLPYDFLAAEDLVPPLRQTFDTLAPLRTEYSNHFNLTSPTMSNSSSSQSSSSSPVQTLPKLKPTDRPHVERNSQYISPSSLNSEPFSPQHPVNPIPGYYAPDLPRGTPALHHTRSLHRADRPPPIGTRGIRTRSSSNASSLPFGFLEGSSASPPHSRPPSVSLLSQDSLWNNSSTFDSSWSKPSPSSLHQNSTEDFRTRHFPDLKNVNMSCK
ncbi:hypothetical protein NEOLI_002008 [Neolecta irregularis DAH-3]|uniref:Fibronectin type-III domain-containing protein n=1 Tax=Neolecta irregularis (strain DAH-3) TaxID=1198029 RepID=A0A1U7LKQ4_NEOID|nr:hypothetical protein NEOLI_002008 [Neolecta irregularis DAH-3]|eukprot:OLL23122.1 hypothetical protein NEOLI_002008 [Neolecta irregularis DAH-3]